jgi:hypothetical protein
MHVEMLVSIDVVHLKPDPAKASKLRANLGVNLATQLWREVESHAEAKGVAREPPVRLHETRYLVGWQHGAGIEQRQMQAYTEGRQGACALYRILHGRCTHHQACRRENPLSMGALDGIVHGQRKTEVVGRHD